MTSDWNSFRTRPELFQLKDMCENLVWIGWNWRYANFQGAEASLIRLHVTCDAHLRTSPSYATQKSCVKIWLGLVEPFKSYRVHKRKKKKKKKNHRHNWKQYVSEKFFSRSQNKTGKAAWLWFALRGGLQQSKASENLGICLIQRLMHMI